MADSERKNLYTVAYITDESEVVINAGSADGIKNGDKFLIFRFGPEIVDPETRVSLGHLELVLGQGEVIHTQEHLASVRSSKKEKTPDRRQYFGEDGPHRSYMSAINALTGKVLTSEIITGETVVVPFSNPSVGDKAKKVGS